MSWWSGYDDGGLNAPPGGHIDPKTIEDMCRGLYWLRPRRMGETTGADVYWLGGWGDPTPEPQINIDRWQRRGHLPDREGA